MGLRNGNITGIDDDDSPGIALAEGRAILGDRNISPATAVAIARSKEERARIARRNEALVAALTADLAVTKGGMALSARQIGAMAAVLARPHGATFGELVSKAVSILESSERTVRQLQHPHDGEDTLEGDAGFNEIVARQGREHEATLKRYGDLVLAWLKKTHGDVTRDPVTGKAVACGDLDVAYRKGPEGEGEGHLRARPAMRL